MTAVGAPRRTSATTARITGPGVGDPGRRSVTFRRRTGRRPRPARAGAFELDRRLAPRSRPMCRTPASEETASNSRPMLDVGTQPNPVSSWCASTARSRSRAGPHRRQVVVPRHARRPQMRQRHPVRPQHARVATGERHVAEVRGPPELLVVGDQHLAAPDRAVGAVAGAVEGDPDDPLVGAEPVLAHHRRDVRVVVLHQVDRPVRRRGAGPAAGPVAGVPVGDQPRRADPGEHLEVPLGAGQRVERGDVVHVADVLADPGVPAARRRRRCSSGRRRRRASAARRTAARSAAARTRGTGGPAARRRRRTG